MKIIIACIRKSKGIILYIFFGVCTIIVTIACYLICAHMCTMGTMPSTVLAWIEVVLFVYLLIENGFLR